ncbi:UvrD-helicase domain-containing protein, partial [Patescibacteria group bacterium]|nr:UvrD-helicase domain-containing protein [Patescibacteria group bacterium]
MPHKLNSAQKQAIEHISGPLLIVAGAGTGKTTVITKKIAYLIEKKLAKPEEILALTFTDKAAGEMEERVDDLLFNLNSEKKETGLPAVALAKAGYVDLQISTFHAFCQRLLEEYGVEMGLPTRFKLLSQTDAWLLMRENIYDFNLDYYRPMGNPTGQIHALLNHFSKCKDELISTQEYLDYVEGLILDKDEAEIQEKNRSIEIADAYHKYNQLLLDNNALDFGDLIFYCVKLLHDRPNILKKLQERFKYILVDEFQDVNWAQYELIKLLAEVAQLTVVGDDDQCLPGNTKVHTPKGNIEIKKLKKGDEVTTAIGKGYYTTSFIKDIKKLNKKARFAEVTTKNGKKITTTDNHIMFAHTPNTSDKKTYYVYIMRRKGWGWRMGITNDLAVRLRLERGADGIIAIKSCKTEAEARFYETIYCLKYNIPTICFKERNGGVQNKEWLKRVFDNIDTEKNIQKLAEDLHIDLNVYHVVLDAVNRGEMRRIKINLTSCHRKYGKKDNTRGASTSGDKNFRIQSPVIQHLLHLETTDRKTIDIIKRLGHNITKAKKGFRLRKASQNYQELENIAKQIALATGGIIDRNFKIAQGKHKVLKSVMMPAKNIMPGLFIPVFHEDKGLFYEEVKDVKYFEKKQTVYDLEIDKTHNFVANNIAVHNSIYSFRGSNVSIIMRFKEDFKNTKEIVLTENYRSAKEILDFAYESIKHNNPDRLEEKLKINKKLEAKGGIKDGEVEHLHFETLDLEVQGVVKKILEIKKQDKDATLDDFAILVRANSHVEPFLNAFEAYNIPYEYLASSGLYRQPVVLDCVNFLNIIENIHNDKAIYRLLRMQFLEFKEDDLQKLTGGAKKKSISYYEACKRAREFFVSPVGIEICQKLISLIHGGMKNSRVEKPTVVLYQFLENSGYLKYLAHEETVGNREVIRQI